VARAGAPDSFDYRETVKRLVLGLLGVLLALLGLALVGGGGVLLSLFGTDGKAQIPIGGVDGDQARAVVVTDFQISSSTPLPVDESWFDLQLEVTGEEPLFVGVAPKRDSLEYLQGVPYELVTGIDSSSDRVESTTIPGDRVPEDPGAQPFWTDQRSGQDTVVAWPISDQDTTLVVMNEDLSRTVSAQVAVVATVSWASPLAIGMMIAGLVVVVLAIVVLVIAMRSGQSSPAPTTPPMARA
jgi:hypothetical protein